MIKEKINFILHTFIKVGMIVFVIGSPFSISLAQIGLVPAIFFWLLLLGINKFKNFRFSSIDIPILLFLLGQLITSIFCEYSKNAFANYQGEWQILMVYLILSSVDRNFYKKLLNILFIVCVIVSIYGLYQHFSGWDIWRQRMAGKLIYSYKNIKFHQITGGFGLHLTFGGYYMMVALLSLAYFLRFEKNKLFYVLGTALIFLATIGSYARSAWFGLLGGSVFLILLTNYKNLKKLLLYISILILFIITILYLVPPIKERMFARWQLYSLKHRFKIWESALLIIKEHPIIGIGNGNFKKYSEKYMKDSGFTVEGHPHNDYLNVYLTAGLMGFIGYILMWFILLKKGIKYVFEEKQDKYLMIGLLSGLVAFMIAGLGQNYFTDSENSMLMWLFIGGVCLLTKQFNNIRGNV